LPSALAAYLRKKGLDCEHVLDAGLAEASDTELCNYASANQRIIISKDQDFLYLASRLKASFQFLWVRLGNCRTKALIEAFERVWPALEVAVNEGERVIEIR
jgi:predicted nuclease of predicted toxin-antitoxin system